MPDENDLSQREPELEPDESVDLTLDDELVLYLDGELDPETTERIEQQLAANPLLRQRAEELKRSYSLLDFLPATQPTPDFTERTITKLELRGSSTALSRSDRQEQHPEQRYRTTGLLGVHKPQRTVTPPWVLALGMLLLFCLGGLAAVVWNSTIDSLDKDRGDLANDYRMLVHLPWYLGVDDLDFLRKLDAPDFFAWNSNQSPVFELVETSPNWTEQMIELFQTFPVHRKQQLRKLDQELHALPPAEEQRLKVVLEAYSIWLDRLTDADRTAVLSASDANTRLLVIQQMRQKQWREYLPVPVRTKIANAATIDERLEFIRQFKLLQDERRIEWQLARRQWEQLHHSNDQVPWPFADPQLASQINDYIVDVFKVDTDAKLEPKQDLPLHMRLSRAEFIELRETRRNAIIEGKWFLYGLTLYRLSERHPYLPEPGQKPAFVSTTMLLPESLKDARYKQQVKLLENRSANRGKWPEFALEVAELSRRMPLVAPPSSTFGPCRIGEFTEPVNRFLTQELIPKLTLAESESLAKLEGKWPEYPKQCIQLCKHPRIDLSMPTVMLPGKPSLWKQYYQFISGPSASTKDTDRPAK